MPTLAFSYCCLIFLIVLCFDDAIIRALILLYCIFVAWSKSPAQEPVLIPIIMYVLNLLIRAKKVKTFGTGLLPVYSVCFSDTCQLRTVS